jgi:RNA-directed DNA polymerase
VWAKARLVRYADDFVIMAKYIDERIIGWVEHTVEGWLALTINRKKTRVIRLTPQGDAKLDFLGYTFGYEWGYTDRTRRFLTIEPSAKAIAYRKAELRKTTDSSRCFVPLPDLVQTINRQIRGWSHYFSFGFSRWAYRTVNAYAVERLTIHLLRRSQRACQPPAGLTYYQFLTRRMGLELL